MVKKCCNHFLAMYQFCLYLDTEMVERMKLQELITGDDNVTLEPSYFWWAIGMCSLIALSAYAVWKTGSVNLQDFGVGFAAILAAGGAAYKLGK